MKRVKVTGAALLIAGLTAAPEPIAAQATFGADLDLFSSYVWRGVSLTNKPVAQPNVYMTVPAGSASITFGGWANVDVGRYDDPLDDFSESGGESGFNLAEFDPYAEVSVPAGRATLTGGITGYLFPNDIGLTNAANTWELYGKVGLDVPFAPALAVYYDIGKVNGAYAEGSLARSFSVSERVSLDLGALAGLSLGQGEPHRPGDTFNFAGDGFTHLDLSAGLPLTAGIFSITPVLHFVVGGDEFTKLTSPSEESDLKVWGGVSISWSRGFGGAAAQ